MGVFLGVDPSANSAGVVVLGAHGATLVAEAVRPTARDWSRVLAHHEAMRAVLTKHRITAAAIEHYAISQHSRSTHLLVEVGAAYRFAFYRHDVEWASLPPTSLKKFTTGSGNATKQQMRDAVKERWGFEHEIEDIVEAYALARWAKESYRHGALPCGNTSEVSPLKPPPRPRK